MPAPTLLVIPSSLDEGASAADLATAVLVRDVLVAAAAAAGFTRANVTIPEFRQIVLRYAPRVPAGLTDKARDAALARLIRADYPADAYLVVGLSRESSGVPKLEAVLVTAPATGEGIVERRAVKYDTLTAADPISDDASREFAARFIADQLPGAYTAANAAVNTGGGSGPPAPPPGPPAPPKPPKTPGTEVETVRPAWHIPVAVGGGVLGGLLLGLLIASAMRGGSDKE